MIKRFWEGWKKFSLWMWNFQTRLILSIFYFVLITPIALVVRVVSDPLKIKKKKKSSWSDPKDLTLSLEKAKEQ